MDAHPDAAAARLKELVPLAKSDPSGYCDGVSSIVFGDAIAKAAAGRSGTIATLVYVLRGAEDSAVTASKAIKAVRNVAFKNPENRSLFVSMGGVQLVVDALRRHKEDGTVLFEAVWLACQLGSQSEENARALVESGLMALLFESVPAHAATAPAKQARQLQERLGYLHVICIAHSLDPADGSAAAHREAAAATLAEDEKGHR